jgi:hypothetical protein
MASPIESLLHHCPLKYREYNGPRYWWRGVLQGARGGGCTYGIWADFQEPDRVAGGLPSWEEHDGVVKEFPRRGLMKELKEVMCHLCRMKPETTYDKYDCGVGA